MVYLAMTAAELQKHGPPTGKLAWMACHFSPYGKSLTNLPTSLPPSSLLIINDLTPVHGHDPIRIAASLRELYEKFQCIGILLDLQRPGCHETVKIVESVLRLPCPVCVSQPYAQDLDCPIFLPPVPLLKTAEEYLAPWRGREVWLELALDNIAVTVTEKGSTISDHTPGRDIPCLSRDRQLNCHFGMVFDQNKAIFTLKREKNDLQNLMKDAEKWGVRHFVGLWQELG